MRRFLWSPKWVVGHVLVVVVAVAFVRLGFWQLDRLEERRAHNRRVEHQAQLPPVTDVSEAVADVAYRQADVQGTFDPANELILFGRALDGRPGNHVLTPLVTEAGEAIVVDRGWVPIELDEAPVGPAAPPPGTVRVTGVLYPSEEDGGGAAGPARVSAIDVALIERGLPYDVAPVYLWALEQEPAQSGELPVGAPLPELDDGPHLSYAIQWFILSTIAAVGWVVLLRREDRERSTAR